MVKPWDEDIDNGIKLTKIRIKHMEKNGMGSEVMKEKKILQQQERHKAIRKSK